MDSLEFISFFCYSKSMVRVFAKKVTEKKEQHSQALQLAEQAVLLAGGERPVNFERNAHGKPFLVPPNERLYVNWSHSGEYVLCAVADRETGVDLQETSKEPRENLVRRVLQPCEKVYYEAREPKDRQRLFYQYWTLKESFLKVLGTGFQTPLWDFYIEINDSEPEIVQRINEKQYQCRLLDFADSAYVAAICCEGRERLESVSIEYLS